MWSNARGRQSIGRLYFVTEDGVSHYAQAFLAQAQSF